LYRQVLSQQPRHADALHQLGVLAYQLGKNAAALELIHRAIAQNPSEPSYYSNLGLVLAALRQWQPAIAAYRQGISLQPNSPDAQNNLGIALQETGRTDEAIAAYRMAIELRRQYPEALNNLGSVLHKQCKLDEAIAAYQAAVGSRPNYAEAHAGLGAALAEKGRLDESMASYVNVIRLRPDCSIAHNNLANGLKEAGQLDEAIACYRKSLAIDPQPWVHSNLLYALLFHPAYDARRLYEEHVRWDELHARPLTPTIPQHGGDQTPRKRLRIGYLSPDFRGHVVGFNVLPLLREHDHSQFEVYCYSNVTSPDAITDRFRSHADAWRDISRIDDGQAAQLIRDDRIDILIDLSLHMAGNRLLVFARKPAPVQATFGGYPGTTGLQAIDYRLSDPFLDPLTDSGRPDGRVYSEKTILLPDSFWCYDPAGEPPPINDLPALQNGFVTLGCLSNFTKINELVLKLWARIMRATPGSRLLLLSRPGRHRQRTAELLGAEGIEPRRLDFVDHQPRDRYLQTYHRIDLGLDTFPYNGHTTSLDSLWMGVPLVTRVGATVVGRAGHSQLSNLGLTEFVAFDDERFVQIASELAADLSRLASFRSTLRTTMRQSPLMDAKRFTHGIEQAYWRIWRECGG